MTVPADTVITIPTRPPGTLIPADSRLNDYELTGHVLGVATGTATGTTRAGTGQKLWAFGLQWTTSPTGRNGTVGITTTVTATGGATGTIHLPVTLPARADRPGGGTSGPMWFLASVPATARTVTVTVTAGQYPQKFDLNTMARRAPTPVALYRTVGSWETIQTLDVTDQIPTPDTDTDFGNQLADATLPVHLHTVTLSWFAPDTPTDIPTNPNQAWLQVDLSSVAGDVIYSPDAYLGYQTPITSSDLTLTIPGEPPIPATVYPGGGPDATGVGIFTGRYAFEVPANLTTATLTVTPGTLQVDSNLFLGTQTITAQSDATFPITLPPTTTPAGPAPGTTSRQHPGTLVPTPAITHPSTTKTKSAPATKTTGGTTVTTNNSRDRSTALIVIITVLVLAVATAGLTYTRRHRRHQKTATAGPTTNGHRSPPSHEPPHPQPAPPTYRTAPTGTARWAGSNTRTTATTTTTTTTDPPPTTLPRPAGTSFVTHPQSTVNASNRSAGRPEPPTVPKAPAAPVPPRTPPRQWQPPQPPPLPDGSIEIAVLGPVTATGWPGDPPPRTLIEIAAFLALHPGQRWTTDALIEALSAERPRFKQQTVRTYLTDLRRALGPDRIPEGGPVGYGLAGVTTDWDRLRTRLADWPRAEATTGRDDRAETLALVRGPAFAGVDRGTWDWVDRGSHGSIRATIDQTVTDLAVTVAEGAIDAADPDLALWATGRGLEVLPGSDTLHRLTLQAAALDIRHRDRLDQAWTAVSKSLRSIGETPSSDLVDLYHDLRSRRAGSR